MASPAPFAVVPSCSYRVGMSDFAETAADRFDLRSWSYYKGYLTAALPGIILGGICIMGTVAYAVWGCSIGCRKNVEWGKRTKSAEESMRHGRALRMCLDLLTVVLSLGVLVTCVWGMSESLRKTDGKGAEFWSLLGQGIDKVEKAVTMANSTIIDLQDLRTTLGVTSAALKDFAQQGVNAEQLRDTFSLISDRLEGKVWMSGLVMSDIYDNLLAGLEYLKSKYQPSVQSAERVWRYVFLGTLFGLLGLSALVAGSLALTSRLPRVTAVSVMILWINTTLITVVGLGGFRCIYLISRDSCLYTEHWVLRLASERSSGSFASERIIRYYLGAYRAESEYHVAREVFGIDYGDLPVIAQSKEAQAVLTYLRSPEGAAAVASDKNLTAQQKTMIQSFPGLVDKLDADVRELNLEVQKPVLDPLHKRAKEIICCELPQIFYQLWITWTVTGCLATALTLLLTARVVVLVRPIADDQVYVKHEPKGKFDAGHMDTTNVVAMSGVSAYAHAIHEA